MLSACLGPTGPVLGDWRGLQSGQDLSTRTSLEIILDGPPDARSGTYHYVSSIEGETASFNDRNLDWSDQWHAQPIVVNGVAMRLVHLDRLAGGHVADFLLTPQGVLVPQPDPRHPDLSSDSMRVALAPVPRGSFGYGRP